MNTGRICSSLRVTALLGLLIATSSFAPAQAAEQSVTTRPAALAAARAAQPVPDARKAPAPGFTAQSRADVTDTSNQPPMATVLPPGVPTADQATPPVANVERQGPTPGIRFRPGVAFRMKHRGFDWSVGPKLTVSKQFDADTTLRLRMQFLPMKMLDLPSGSRLDYAQYDLSLLRFLNRKTYVIGNVALHAFRPSGTLISEVARRGGSIRSRDLTSSTLSVGRQVFVIKWRFRNKTRTWPIYVQANYTFVKDYDYGTDLGSAGTDFPMRKGFSWNFNIMQRRF